jgi:hypothetical protein
MFGKKDKLGNNQPNKQPKSIARGTGVSRSKAYAKQQGALGKQGLPH